MAHDPVPLRLKPGIFVQQDLYAEVQLAVAPGVSLIADLGHLRDALIHPEPQSVLIQSAVLARAHRDHHKLLVAEHGAEFGDGLGELGLAVDADLVGHHMHSLRVSRSTAFSRSALREATRRHSALASHRH
ncbi:hypothetical protein D3C86_1909470 [compost metagenome]